ncbi:hypothetical protein QVD17_05887 [Tagetes erecta]|uniref:Uncharacterized protein n=1 Tax=Tagetes erecta TaxID=13708 RepID=A0AAD8LEN4_TARER|nr:hypothetical protein QVD17_05887 [Tagetes erecta]
MGRGSNWILVKRISTVVVEMTMRKRMMVVVVEAIDGFWKTGSYSYYQSPHSQHRKSRVSNHRANFSVDPLNSLR